jgi:BirA family transcriptional regulator, biotin operon repressor / biotin---[acetyl-CoA-carboxylase] ligase
MLMFDRFAPTPLTFRALRLLSDGEFRSGAALARTLGVSRTSVWKSLQGVEQAGVPLTRLHARGYRLAAPIDWLDPEAIRGHLGVHGQLYRMRIEDMLASTNTTLLQEATAGAPSGSMLATELQTRGRGRRGRDWHSGLGGALTFSVLWRFEQGAGYLAGLGPAVGVALVRALRAFGVQDTALKWPNDVLVRHQKVAGTLVEIQGDVLGPSAAVIGIGVNFQLDEMTRQRIDQAVIDLRTAGVPADRNRVLAQLLIELAEVLNVFAARGFGALRKEWEGMHVYSGRAVSVRLPDGAQQEGTVAGVGDDGALLLQTSSGLRRFHSGEVSLRATSEPDRRRWTSNG